MLGSDPSPIPALLNKPLLKKEGGPIHGVQSGRRSALIKVQIKDNISGIHAQRSAQNGTD